MLSTLFPSQSQHPHPWLCFFRSMQLQNIVENATKIWARFRHWTTLQSWRMTSSHCAQLNERIVERITWQIRFTSGALSLVTGGIPPKCPRCNTVDTKTVSQIATLQNAFLCSRRNVVNKPNRVAANPWFLNQLLQLRVTLKTACNATPDSDGFRH